MITRLFVPFVLLLAGAASAQPVVYFPASGATVPAGDSINVWNKTTEWMSVRLRGDDGEPFGDPILIPPGQIGTVEVPVDPAFLGRDFELDPDIPSSQLDGW